MGIAGVEEESQNLIEGARIARTSTRKLSTTHARSLKIVVGALSVGALLVLGVSLSGVVKFGRGRAPDENPYTNLAQSPIAKAVPQEVNLERKCASSTENCMQYGCCADAGHQCYAKDSKFGMCFTTCDPAEKRAYDPLKAAWSCDPIGTRYTPDYREDYSPNSNKESLVEPWVKNCSHIGESCATTKCCAFTGYYCYEKDASWSSCLSACKPGKENGGISELPVVQKGKPLSNPPAHVKPTFKKAPPGPWSCKRKSVPLTPGSYVGTSLFCFTFVTDDRGKGKTHDFELLSIAQREKVSIFACDHWVVFSDVDKPLNPGRTVKVGFPKLVKRPNTKIFVNLPVFLNVWKNIKQEGTWKGYAWTVKVDPYTVFIPQRLRDLVVHQAVPEAGAYLENCKHVRMGFHGSLEVVSRNAFGNFLDHLDSCQNELPIKNGTHTHFKYYGEDKFFAFCMHKHGIGRIPSRQEVVTVPAGQPIYGLHTTISCPAHNVPQIADKSSKQWKPDCKRVQTAGIHQFIKPKEYSKCLNDMRSTGQVLLFF